MNIFLFKNHLRIVNLSIFVLINSFSSIAQLSNYKTYLPSSTSKEVYHNNYYSFSYLEEEEISEWTVYFSTVMDSIGLVKRSNSFKADKQVNKGSASLADYKKSGFDRGHLVPAADMSFNSTAMKESFLMSNMAPQRPSFNRGIWKQLESRVRNWTSTYDSLVVISGCITNEIDTTIGVNKVAVPASYYKIILDVNTMNTIAFVIPNLKAEKTLNKYIETIDYIEEVTEIDFFFKLPLQIQYSLEKSKAEKLW